MLCIATISLLQLQPFSSRGNNRKYNAHAMRSESTKKVWGTEHHEKHFTRCLTGSRTQYLPPISATAPLATAGARYLDVRLSVSPSVLPCVLIYRDSILILGLFLFVPFLPSFSSPVPYLFTQPYRLLPYTNIKSLP